MLLAQISDTHFRGDGEKLYDFIDINSANAEVVAQLNALREQPDAVIVSGDIVNCGRPQEYQMAARILGHLRQSLWLIPGNHDDKAQFVKYLAPLCPHLGNDPQNIRYVVDDYPLRMLFIDSSESGQSAGWLTDNTLGWLETELRRSTRPTALFMHHPPLALGSAQMDAIACRNGEQLMALAAHCPALEYIFCGHNHCLIQTRSHHTLVTTVPGTVHQVPYHHQDNRPYYDLSPSSCLMHRWIDDRLVNYLHPLSHYAGPWLYDPASSCPAE